MKTPWIPIAILLLALPAAAATDVWIDVDPPRPDTGAEIRVRLVAGDRFDAPRPYDGTPRTFQRVWKKGRQLLEAEATFAAENAGVQLIAFDAPPAGAATAHYGKALVVVGQPDPGSPMRWSELGQRLEIVPQTDPVALVRGAGALEVQILFEREPLADVTVSAVFRGKSAQEHRATTDEIGVARLPVEGEGPWLVRVRHRPTGGTEVAATLVLSAGS